MNRKCKDPMDSISVEDYITKFLPVRTMVITKSLRKRNEDRGVFHYLFCDRRGHNHRSGRSVGNKRKCRIGRQAHNRRDKKGASHLDPGTEGAISPAAFNSVSPVQLVYGRKG